MRSEVPAYVSMPFMPAFALAKAKDVQKNLRE
jgi:hypothetical protein